MIKAISRTKLVLSCILGVTLAACQQAPKPTQLNFTATYQDQPIECKISSRLVNTDFSVDQLAFFISHLELKINNQWQSASFSTNRWQQPHVALINLISSDCTAETSINNQLKLSHEYDMSSVEAMRFDLGVPFRLNHLNPLVQSSPLNLPSMFWSWQTGHKFVRLDMSDTAQGWSYHLGSVGCTSDSRLRAPSTSCLHANRFEMQLRGGSSNEINLDLSKLLANVELGERGCVMHTDNEPACANLISNTQQGIFTWR